MYHPVDDRTSLVEGVEVKILVLLAATTNHSKEFVDSTVRVGCIDLLVVLGVPRQCGMVLLLEYILSRERPTNRLFKAIHMHDLEEMFALATIQHAKQVRKVVSDLEYVSGLEVYVGEFVCVAGMGLYQQVLWDTGYIAEVTKMLCDVSVLLINRGALTGLKEPTHSLSIMATLVHADEPDTLRNIRDLLASGYLETFVRVMANRQVNKYHRDDLADTAITTLNLVDEWTVYPSVCEILSKVRITYADNLIHDTPDVRDVWVPLCNLALSRAERRKDGSKYDHKARALHAKYIEKLYRQHAPEIAEKAMEQQPRGSGD
ncbi:hypothetical protein FA13DRAFT_1718965 [Coprinellus micaceus]|uniref:Uncharacterized protein n=1 Tax=Coprinellus micaceus TaxID=71717 RepID=A0A4Y7SCW5_COPMI|nr:hypothetical protein FA13DRAFT_1718965 [Coprinellus micaceus]